jgi:hypothetical protein
MDTKVIRIIFMLSSIALGIAMLVVDSLYYPGWISAAKWGYGLSFLYIFYATAAQDKLIQWFWLFALTAGVSELFADKWLVEVTRTLIYPPNEPMWLASPIYMPFSWLVVLMQLCFIAFLLANKLKKWQTSIALALLGGAMIPLYEHWAIGAKWWDYVNTPKFYDVPYYIMVAEAILVLPLPYMMADIDKQKWYMPVIYGIGEGLVMLLACIIAYYSVG